MKVEITDFQENDKERIKQIYSEVRQTNFTWLTQEFSNLSSFDNDTKGESILVAKVENEIVGFASVWHQDNFLHHLYILNHYQRKGIGKMLLNRIVENADSDLTLKCLKKNTSGINFYLRMGWIPVSEGTSTEGDYILFKFLISKN